MKQYSRSKGQLSTLDLIVASMIFVAIIYSFIWTWTEVEKTVWTYEAVQGQLNKGNDLTDIFLHTQGEPVYWANIANATSKDVDSLGLVLEPNVLEQHKLDALWQMDYPDAKRIMGLGKDDFYILITDLDGDKIFEYGNREADTSTAIERMALLNGEVVKFNLRLY